jgi:formylmethanofuran dehydrogenase subunit E
MAKKKQHIHKYQKQKWGKNETIIWRCVHPGCTHYCSNELVNKRLSICHACGEPFVMNPDKMRRKKPKCDKCQHKGDPIMQKLDALLENL